ncbi:hypothetical protein SAMN05421846_103286 [Chryseobacterium taeanense]|uniref:Uncharacterized protein n=1 Tax=Chryseobacterium taeanense TaxID=311334 RepID=A0A1G8H7G4_9FLAO|nr:hypothetical protein SAMN05421846_103286 [Chryseobacterium taeanense]
MKSILIAGGLLVSSVCFSQVAIGKTSVTNNWVSLEFGNTENRGLILPWVKVDPDTKTIPDMVDGMIIFDPADAQVKAVVAGTWQTLSAADPNAGTLAAVDTSLQETKPEVSSAMVRIGDTENPDLKGILVLSDTDKAMVLPKVASPHLNIIDPAPGLVVYDTTAHQIAVFNGQGWSFWGPK